MLFGVAAFIFMFYSKCKTTMYKVLFTTNVGKGNLVGARLVFSKWLDLMSSSFRFIRSFRNEMLKNINEWTRLNN